MSDGVIMYEDVRGEVARPLYDILGQQGTYQGESLAEIRRSENDTRVDVHGENGYSILRYNNECIEYSQMRDGIQTTTTLRGDQVERTQQAWDAQNGLNGPVTVASVSDPAVAANALRTMQTGVNAQLELLDRYRGMMDPVRPQLHDQDYSDRIAANNLPARTSGPQLG